MKKDYVVALRIEQDIGQKIEDLADAKHVPVGQILRWAILKYVEDKEIHREEEITPCKPTTNSSTE